MNGVGIERKSAARNDDGHPWDVATAASEVAAEHTGGGSAAEPGTDGGVEAGEHGAVDVGEGGTQPARAVDGIGGVRRVTLRSGVSLRKMTMIVGKK